MSLICSTGWLTVYLHYHLNSLFLEMYFCVKNESDLKINKKLLTFLFIFLYFLWNDGTPSGVHLFGHLLWPIVSIFNSFYTLHYTIFQVLTDSCRPLWAAFMYCFKHLSFLTSFKLYSTNVMQGCQMALPFSMVARYGQMCM